MQSVSNRFDSSSNTRRERKLLWRTSRWNSRALRNWSMEASSHAALSHLWAMLCQVWSSLRNGY